MPRNFGIPRKLYQRKPIPPALKRMAIGVGIGLAVSVAAVLSPHPAPAAVITCGRFGCSDWHGGREPSARRHIDAHGNRVLLGGRPSGCPNAYCGCGLARHLGLHDKRLNRAWAWAEIFPRTNARAGAVAVRRHHVMQLEHHISGSRWLVRSYNDYRRKSWLIVRSVRGYVFVDPQNSHLASN